MSVFALSSLNSISELCDGCMFVCMCLKGSVNYGQTVGVFFVFFHEAEWVNIIFRIQILEGQQNCMNSLKFTICDCFKNSIK